MKFIWLGFSLLLTTTFTNLIIMAQWSSPPNTLAITKRNSVLKRLWYGLLAGILVGIFIMRPVIASAAAYLNIESAIIPIKMDDCLFLGSITSLLATNSLLILPLLTSMNLRQLIKVCMFKLSSYLVNDSQLICFLMLSTFRPAKPHFPGISLVLSDLNLDGCSIPSP